MKHPTISVVVATYNSSKTISECLRSIRSQEYPQQSVEIILADGGSKDDTKEIARKFHARFIPVDSSRQGAEYNRAVGAQNATGELLFLIDHDNMLPHNRLLAAYVSPLVDDRNIVAVETLRYTYDPKDSLIGRYFSLFGVNDIFAYYVGKADRLSYLHENPKSYGVFRNSRVQEKDGYFIVDFDANGIPTLGSNGCMIRKKVLMEHASVSPEDFFHIDVHVDVIRKGFRRYAFIKDAILHKTDERGLVDYLRRRKLFMQKYHFIYGGRRRYSLFEAKDLVRTVLFIIYGLTWIKPTIDAMRGFLKIQDIAWFLNPIMCFSIVILYGFAIIEHQVHSYAKKILEK